MAVGTGFPGTMRVGFGVLAVGVVLDLAAHALAGGRAGHAPGRTLAHWTVLAGMLLVLSAIPLAALRSRRRPDRSGGRRTA